MEKIQTKKVDILPFYCYDRQWFTTIKINCQFYLLSLLQSIWIECHSQVQRCRYRKKNFVIYFCFGSYGLSDLRLCSYTTVINKNKPPKPTGFVNLVERMQFLCRVECSSVQWFCLRSLGEESEGICMSCLYTGSEKTMVTSSEVESFSQVDRWVRLFTAETVDSSVTPVSKTGLRVVVVTSVSMDTIVVSVTLKKPRHEHT